MDTQHFREKLEAEKARLEEELGKIAVVNPENPEDWEAKPAEAPDTAFHDEIADKFEELTERHSEETTLEKELHLVKEALARIEAGTYGHCRICGAEIEVERLEAMPAADTCKAHLNEK